MNARPVASLALLMGLCAPAGAWEVVGSSLPTFAQAPVGSSSLARPWSSLTGDPFAASAPPSGYDFRIGKNLLLGVDSSSGLSPGFAMGGISSAFDMSSTRVKLGYDLGRLTPYVSAGFGEVRPLGIGGSAFSAASNPFPAAANPFSAPTTTSVGAGFDYALTDKVTIGVGVSAIQTNTGWQR